jgi:hypothetical protein
MRQLKKRIQRIILIQSRQKNMKCILVLQLDTIPTHTISIYRVRASMMKTEVRSVKINSGLPQLVNHRFLQSLYASRICTWWKRPVGKPQAQEGSALLEMETQTYIPPLVLSYRMKTLQRLLHSTPTIVAVIELTSGLRLHALLNLRLPILKPLQHLARRLCLSPCSSR